MKDNDFPARATNQKREKGEMTSSFAANRVALTGFNTGQGGIPRFMRNLANGLAEAGVAVDLLLGPGEHPDLEFVREGVRPVILGRLNSPSAIAALAEYFRRTRPAAVISNREKGRLHLLLARDLSRTPVKIAFRVGNPVSVHLGRRAWHKRLPRRAAIRWSYRRADAIIAVSRGIGSDVLAETGIDAGKLFVLPNPVIDDRIFAMGREAVPHPWLAENEIPVIIGVGRLARQKDFPTLIQAFARVRRDRACRLILLGEGKERENLSQLAESLGIGADVDLPGYTENPFAFVRRAALFVLSSAWEGFPNVLAEALAVGTPAVATDCVSGPRDILADGKYGPLVPVGDIEAMAHAIAQTLSHPPAGDFLQEAVTPYWIDRSARSYLRALGIEV